jgi:glycosyl transferase, family 25
MWRIVLILLISLIIIKFTTNKENFINQNKPKFNIGKIYLINLDKSPDRLQYMKKQLNKNNINFERFSAIDGSKLDTEKLTRTNMLKTNKMMIGAVGCSLSHINLWKKIQNSNHKYTLILEDDTIIMDNFWEQFNTYSKQIPDDFDILYLGGSNIDGRMISTNILTPKITKSNSTKNTGMYGMIINKRVIPILLKHNIPIKDNIDQVVKNHIFDKIKVYYIIPVLIKHNNSFYSMRRINSNRIPLTRWFKETQSKITIND